MRLTPLATASLAATIACAAPTTSSAAPISVREATAHVAAGVRLFKAARFDAALAEFLLAEPAGSALGDQAGLLFNIARCREELGQNPEAIAAFERYLQLPDAPETQSLARERIAGLVARTYGGLSVTCEGKGVTVRVAALDAAERSCPTQFSRVSPGPYSVEAIVGGKVAQRAQADVEVAVVSPVRLDPRGELTVRTAARGATVLVDGRDAGEAPVTVRLDEGQHTVILRAAGYEEWTVVAPILSGMPAEVVAELVPRPASADSGTPWLWWGLGGAVAAGAGVAAYFLLADPGDASTRDVGRLSVRSP